MADRTGDELHHYLVLLYNKIIEGSLKKHSKRPSSAMVSINLKVAIKNYTVVIIISGHGMVERNKLLTIWKLSCYNNPLVNNHSKFTTN
jgi:hypothetical protein